MIGRKVRQQDPHPIRISTILSGLDEGLKLHLRAFVFVAKSIIIKTTQRIYTHHGTSPACDLIRHLLHPTDFFFWLRQGLINDSSPQPSLNSAGVARQTELRSALGLSLL
jgi:hypothetical protein